MKNKSERRVSLRGFTLVLSLLCHFCLLMWLGQAYVSILPQSEAPGYFIPAYMQTLATASQTPAMASENTATKEEQSPQEPHGLSVATQKSVAHADRSLPEVMPSSPADSTETIDIPKSDEEPLHLVGKSKIIKPLIKVLAQALQHHLRYPKSAADFHLTGTVLIGFTLHPEGLVTDAKVVQSSGAGVLDDAAQEAVMRMSPVTGARPYVTKPEYLVVGIIFG